jgi:hypothetical protein
MNTYFLACFFVCLVTLNTGCSGSKSAANSQGASAAKQNDDELLLGTWMRSHEENGKAPNGAYIFRNVKFYNFPRARGRDGFTFSTESKCVYIAIAPTDGSEEQPGKYGWGGKGQLKITLENGRSINLKIQELTAEKMVAIEE